MLPDMLQPKRAQSAVLHCNKKPAGTGPFGTAAERLCSIPFTTHLRTVRPGLAASLSWRPARMASFYAVVLGWPPLQLALYAPAAADHVLTPAGLTVEWQEGRGHACVLLVAAELSVLRPHERGHAGARAGAVSAAPAAMPQLEQCSPALTQSQLRRSSGWVLAAAALHPHQPITLVAPSYHESLRWAFGLWRHDKPDSQV